MRGRLTCRRSTASWWRSTRGYLRLLGRGVHPMDTEQPEDATDESVEEGQGHDRQASPSLLWLVKLRQGVFGPFKF